MNKYKQFSKLSKSNQCGRFRKKIRYDSRQTATEAGEALKIKYPNNHTARAYKCSQCNHWHLTVTQQR